MNSSPHQAEIYALATEVFGTKSKAEVWLNSFHPILGCTPSEMAKSELGATEVKKILTAIQYGGLV